MRILVLSDSHHLPISLPLAEYDYIIHAGDMGMSLPLLKKHNAYYVRGNCDLTGPKERDFTINNKRIYLTHGDLYNVKYDLNRLVYKGMDMNADIVIYGHTHIESYFMLDNIIYLNPGAYKDGSYIEIDDNNIYFYKNNTLDKKLAYRW